MRDKTRCEILDEMLGKRDEDVEYLRKELSKSSNLLSDQRSNADKEAEREAQNRARMNEVQESIRKMEMTHKEEMLLLKRQNHRILAELNERRKPFWKWLFGSKQPPAQSGKQRA